MMGSRAKVIELYKGYTICHSANTHPSAKSMSIYSVDKTGRKTNIVRYSGGLPEILQAVQNVKQKIDATERTDNTA